MLFNPIVALVLAAISWVFGLVVLNDSASWLGMIPSLFFTAWFAFSLFRPVMESSGEQSQAGLHFRSQTKSFALSSGLSEQTSGRPSRANPPAAIEKLTVNKLRTYSTAPFGARR